MTAENENAGLSRGELGEMTLNDALAVYLFYLKNDEKIGEREERILDAAWEIIERQAKKAIALPEDGPAQ